MFAHSHLVSGGGYVKGLLISGNLEISTRYYSSASAERCVARGLVQIFGQQLLDRSFSMPLAYIRDSWRA